MTVDDFMPALVGAAAAILIMLVGGALAIGCGPPRKPNPVDVASVPPERRAEALAAVASAARGRLPGVRIFVLPYPVQLPDGRAVTSYRVPGPNAFIVLSWRLLPDGRFVVADAPWEVEHLLAGTDDLGRPLR